MFTGFHFEAASVSLALRQLTPLFIFTFVVAIVGSMPIKNWIAAAIESRGLEQVSLLRIVGVGSFVVSLALLLVCMFSLSGGGYNPFIYFRF